MVHYPRINDDGVRAEIQYLQDQIDALESMNQPVPPPDSNAILFYKHDITELAWLYIGSGLQIDDIGGVNYLVNNGGGGGGGGDGTVTDGDYGDVIVSGSGLVWTIPAGAVAFADLASKPTTLAGYGIVDAAAASHTHPQSDITNLVSDLAGKAASSHTHNTSDITAGTLAAARMPALTGDVTTSAGAVATTIANDAVTYAKMQNISATARFLGRITSGAGDPEELTGTQATTLLDLFATSATTKGLVPGSNSAGATFYLDGTGNWSVPAGSGGISDGDKGDVTVSSSGTVWTIDNNVVTFAKMQDIATDRLIGRDTASTGDPEEISVGGGLEFSGSASIQRSALTGDVTASAGSNSTTLATVNSNVGTFGSATAVAQVTVNGKGLVTAASDVTISVTSGAISDFTEAVQDVVGALLPGSEGTGDLDWTYTDGSNTLTAVVKSDAITTAKILNDNVTYAKIQNVSATDRILGRDTASAGDIEELTVSGGLEFTGGPGIQRSALTGDVTASAGSNATTLATVNSNVGTFGSATQVGQFTVNGKGLITAASNVTITVPTAASTTEVLTGTDTAKFVTADALAAIWEKGSDVASAATVSLGEGGLFHITGTTTITDIDFATAKDGRIAVLVFDGALTLTHNATTLKLPGGANITTVAGDRAIVVQDSSDNVIVVAYIRNSGTVDPAAKSQTDFITGMLGGTVSNGDYMLALKVPYGFTITNVITKSTAGTGTATFKINTTALGGTANSVSTTESDQAHASSNVVASGDDINVTISSVSSLANMSFTIVFTRTLS